jgi:hypothetical protein
MYSARKSLPSLLLLCQEPDLDSIRQQKVLRRSHQPWNWESTGHDHLSMFFVLGGTFLLSFARLHTQYVIGQFTQTVTRTLRTTLLESLHNLKLKLSNLQSHVHNILTLPQHSTFFPRSSNLYLRNSSQYFSNHLNQA